jgi:hypothetical protein
VAIRSTAELNAPFESITFPDSNIQSLTRCRSMGVVPAPDRIASRLARTEIEPEIVHRHFFG